MKKFIALLISIVVLTAGLVGCGSEAQQTETKQTESKQTESAVQTSQESTSSVPDQNDVDAVSDRVVTDELGREVTIPADPQRVLGLTSAVMEALYNIGIEPIGKVEEYKIREEGISLESIGMTNSLNIEKICELEPDFIIASSRYHASIRSELELAGCPVCFFDPDATGEISIVDLTPFVGELMGREGEGNQYKQEVLSLAQNLKEQITQTGDVKTGLIIKTGDSITCAQKSSGYGALLILLGIENIVPADLPNAKKLPYVVYDSERIIMDDPDIVLVIAPGNDSEANQALLQDIKQDDKWSDLSAVKNNNMHMMPFKLNPNRQDVKGMLQSVADLILDNK
jgi:iron complex transport system substrate-binding protein